MTGGQPARGPELMGIWYTNMVERGHRNLFTKNSMNALVTRWASWWCILCG